MGWLFLFRMILCIMIMSMNAIIGNMSNRRQRQRWQQIRQIQMAESDRRIRENLGKSVELRRREAAKLQHTADRAQSQFRGSVPSSNAMVPRSTYQGPEPPKTVHHPGRSQANDRYEPARCEG